MTTQITMDTVKAALKVVDQKRAIKNRIEKAAEVKIAEAKERAEKAYAEKIANAESELDAALKALDETYTAFKTGGSVEVAEVEASVDEVAEAI